MDPTAPLPDAPGAPVVREPAPAYLAALLLRDRRVVAVGGGRVHARRVPVLLAAGAAVTVVAPRLEPSLAALAAAGAISWLPREFAEADLDGAWYVLAATDSPEVNARVVAAAEQRHTFCVRADAGALGSAWTPATAGSDGISLGVIAAGDPRRAGRVRDRLMEWLGSGAGEA